MGLMDHKLSLRLSRVPGGRGSLIRCTTLSATEGSPHHPTFWVLLVDSTPFATSVDSTHIFVFRSSVCIPSPLFCRVSQKLLDGVAGSRGHISAPANPLQSLIVSSICPEESGRGAHYL